jgi:adenine-specific DNA-methyltransferase
MGRAAKGRKPFRFVWNRSQAVASNLYLLLYPRGALKATLAAEPKRHEAVFAALRETGTELFLREGRVYGGGLYKMEPKELARLPAEAVLRAVPGLAAPRQGSLFPDLAV